MPVEIRARSPVPSRRSGPETALTIAALSSLAAATVSVSMLPPPLVLPAVSLTVLVIAALVAALAWRAPFRPTAERLNYWDIAGALTLVGIVAALLSDTQQVLPLLEGQRDR